MASFARPSADISRGNWVTHSGATANLWATIDEESADDADFVQSANNDNTVYEVRLSSVAPAVIPRDHTLFLRGRKDSNGGNIRGVTVALVQGTTVLGSTSFDNLPATVAQQSVTLPRAMAAGITDYADLRLRFTPTGTISGNPGVRRRVIVTGAALRVPAASDLVDDLLTRWGIVVDSQNGTVQVSHSGFIGTGNTLARAILDLYEKMREADFASAERERRWTIARGLWKVIEYERIRAEIVAGTYDLPAHQTPAEGIAICDTKIARFIAFAKTADAAETA